MKSDEQIRVDTVRRVTWIGLIANLLLSLGKVLAGLLGKSTAMLADGIHSLSDLITDVVVLVFVGVSGKERDHDHHYGHGKYETFASMLVSFVLCAVGIGIFISGIKLMLQGIRGEPIERPGYLALIAAPVSILVKEWLFRYTRSQGRKTSSSVMMANAWHHRSDALSSVGTLIGISGAMFLGEQWRILDPITSMIVSVFIVKVGVDLALPSINELLEVALPKELETEIMNIIRKVPGVDDAHNLKTRKNGNTYVIDVHIRVDKTFTVLKSHNIASQVEKDIREHYGHKTYINVHVEPGR
ncbi:MAG: cation diffusion facilitator family transporter [Bacteroidales bacterium]